MLRTALVVASIAAAASAQTPNATGLQDVLRQADRRRADYVETFKSLTAVETRLTEIFDRNGLVERRRTVVSDFLVYQSELKDGVVSEYRIARAVDGIPVRNSTEDAIKLFQRLAQAKTLEQQEKQLREANLKHVLRYFTWGATLDPINMVREDRRADLDFAIAGRERVDGLDAIVLQYETKALRAVDARGIHRHFKHPRSGHRGRAWLDANDGHLVQWNDELIVVDDDMSAPVTLVRNEIAYGPSAFGVFTPTRFVASFFDRTENRKAPTELRLEGRITSTYTDFKRFQVTTGTDIRLPRTEWPR